MDKSSLEFKIVHLSDLHIRGGSSQRNMNHKHSIPHMRGIQKIIENEADGLDRLIITGDISHYGDEENLLMASQWIFSSLSIGNGEHISIGLSKEEHHKIKLIPGNHDAWNTDTHGKPVARQQKSLSNFNFAFGKPEKPAMPLEDGYFYDWIEKNGRGIFFTYLDSSFLGDTKIEKDNPTLISFDKIAKGKLSKTQAGKVLMLYDKGMLGQLKKPSSEELIPKDKFTKSLKIVVMHHYLFEPIGQKREPLLQMNDTEVVFRNFALADTDILICGHKHFAESKEHLYLHHFDKRAKARYIFNYFRRLIGIHSLPVQYQDRKGRKINSLISSFISLLLINKRQASNDNTEIKTDQDFVDKLSEILIKGIDKPDNFEHEVRDFILKNKLSAVDDDLLNEAELLEIASRIRISLNDQEKQKIKVLAMDLKRIIKKLYSRQFLQLMAGSACKAHNDEGKIRSFNIYRITPNLSGFLLKCDRYNWDKDGKEFNPNPQSVLYEFKDDNRPLH